MFTQSQDLASHTAWTMSRLRVTKKLRGDIARTANPGWPKGFTPCGIMLSNESWGKEEEGMLEVMAFVFPRNHCVLWALLS